MLGGQCDAVSRCLVSVMLAAARGAGNQRLLILSKEAAVGPMEPTSGMDAPAEPPVETAEPTAEQEQQAKDRADAMEALMLEVQADEANWQLDDRLDFLLKTG